MATMAGVFGGVAFGLVLRQCKESNATQLALPETTDSTDLNKTKGETEHDITVELFSETYLLMGRLISRISIRTRLAPTPRPPRLTRIVALEVVETTLVPIFH